MSANTYLPGTIVIPSALTITAITQAFPMVVTIIVNDVTEYNSYIVGQLVRLFVPSTYQMIQANGIQGTIVNISASNFSLDIDSTNFDAFVVPPPYTEQPATLSPAGSRNLQFSNTTGKVPFQSLNNVGN